jgi:hypothetical protein
MNGILVVLILLGLMLTVGGALVMFTDRGLEWMYKQGIWSLKGEVVHDKAKDELTSIFEVPVFSCVAS